MRIDIREVEYQLDFLIANEIIFRDKNNFLVVNHFDILRYLNDVLLENKIVELDDYKIPIPKQFSTFYNRMDFLEQLDREWMYHGVELIWQ